MHSQASNKYTYLSMCPVCNIVSKTANAIKTHLQQKHACVSVCMKKKVIPIRVESKYVKTIRRILAHAFHTPASFKLQKVKDEKEQSGKEEEADFGIKPVKKEVPKKMDSMAYFENSSECLEVKVELIADTENVIKDVSVCSDIIENENVILNKVNSSDTEEYLEVKVELVADTESVNKDVSVCSDIIENENFTLNKVNSSDTEEYECPYCKLYFSSSDSIQCHVASRHSEHVQTVKVKRELEEMENRLLESAETIVIMCSCQTCGQSFHSLSELTLHVECLHSSDSYRGYVLDNKTSTKVSDLIDSSLDRINTKKENFPTQNPEYLSVDCSVKVIGDVDGVLRLCSKPTLTESHVSPLLSSDIGLNTAGTEHFKKSLGKYVQTGVIVAGCSYLSATGTDTYLKNFTGNASLIHSIHNDVENVNSSKNKKKRKHNSELEVFNNKQNKGMKSNKKRTLTASKNKLNETELNFHDSSTASGCASTGNFLSVSGCRSSSKLDDCNAVSNKGDEGVKREEERIEYNMCYKCPFCDFFLFYRNYIISHVQSVHPEVKNVTLKDVVKSSVKMKASEARREYFQCPGCDYATPYRESLIASHITRCFAKSGNRLPVKVNCILPDSVIDTHFRSAILVCPTCKMAIQGKDMFDIHLNKHFSDVNIKVKLTMVLPDIEKTDEDLIIKYECFICTYCSYLHNERYNLRNHMRQRHKQEVVSPVIKCILIDKNSSGKSYFMTKFNFFRANEKSNRSDGEQIMNLNFDRKISGVVVEGTQEKDGEMKEKDSELNKKDCEKMVVENKSYLPEKRLMCPVCNYSTDSKRETAVHFKVEHPERIKTTDVFYFIPDNLLQITEKNGEFCLSCKLCKASGQTLYALLWHIEVKHAPLPSSEPYVPVNMVKYSGKPRNYNVVTLSGMNKVNEQSEVLPSTMSSLAMANSISFKCLVCKKEMSEKDSLDRHIQDSHPEMSDLRGMVDHMIDIVSAASAFRVGESDKYNCGLCLETNFNKRDFYNHLYSEHSPKKHEKTHALSNKALQRVSDNGVRCEICQKIFKDGECLKLHLNVHMCMCQLCGVWSRNSGELATHMKTFHQFGDGLCVVCACKVQSNATTFTEPSNKDVDTHIKSHNIDHTDKLPCHFCGLEFTSSIMKYHLDNKHSTATYCNVCTTQTVARKQRCHRCRYCEGVFCQQYYLDLHMFEKHSKKKLDKVKK